ncbi:hypothetical protein CEXT_168171 [Caerostris extrusa]|uniref:Uncharacterized protein n=1 Tax=Caerostris extrusa TaxID=172846 RepID=A0AAV4S931_CAEEX|nr:hypothetical protein CEXT_168171 [Caerostris extrusa]
MDNWLAAIVKWTNGLWIGNRISTVASHLYKGILFTYSAGTLYLIDGKVTGGAVSTGAKEHEEWISSHIL